LNITGWDDVGSMNWNISFSNSDRVWQQTSLYNVSFGNTTEQRDIGIMHWVVSFGNTIVDQDVGTMHWNISYANTSVRVWQQPFMFNISFGNTTTNVEVFSYNISFSNDEPWQDIGSMYWVISFGNYSESPYITITYPENDSNIQVGQPTVCFTLVSPLGRTMNYTVYYGNSSTNTTTILFSDVNVTNGTYCEMYYGALNFSTYYWRVYLDDGTYFVNETFHFLLHGGLDIFPTPGFEIGLVLLSLFVIVFWRRKKKHGV